MRLVGLVQRLWTTQIVATNHNHLRLSLSSSFFPTTTRNNPSATLLKMSSNDAAASTGSTDDDKINRPVLRGVVFDMDGTLTIPNLDFAEMYRRCGVDRSDDILRAIAAMEDADAERANAIVEEMEAEGRRTLQLMPGTKSVLQWLAFHNIPMALVTRNTYASTQRLLELLQEEESMFLQQPTIQFAPIISRDFQPAMPPKPNAAALHHIAQEWTVELSKDLVMVGDSPSNDIVFGKNAGVATALLWAKQQQPPGDGSDSEGTTSTGGADMVVSHLAELPRQLFQRYNMNRVGTKHLPLEAPRPSSMAAQAAYNADLPKMQRLSLQELLAQDEHSNTPLIWASEAGHEQVVQHILETLASHKSSASSSSTSEHPFNHIHVQGYQGSTALARATRRGHSNIVELLLRQHSTTTSESSSNDNSINISANTPNAKLQYPLHIAAFRQHASIVEMLLQAGADAHAVDHKGRTPADDTQCPECRRLLQTAMTV